MQLVFATNNKNKISEVKKLLPISIELLSLSDIKCYEAIPETQSTIEGNAVQKAAYVYENYGYNCFADDTGLEVKALNGAPGVYSARYAGAERSDKANMNKLLNQLKCKSDRSAQFKTVIALIINGNTTVFEGICEGEILTQQQGTNGFGYDPVFKPNAKAKSFAEMSLEEKNAIGHRGKAMRKLINHLLEMK